MSTTRFAGAVFGALFATALVARTAAAATDDPLFETAQLVASDAILNDAFGARVAVSGNIVAVARGGYPTGLHNAAYVFERPAAGWGPLQSESARLIAQPDRKLGPAVAVSGDTVVVATEGWTEVLVFVRPAGGWKGAVTQAATLRASGGASIGHAVAIAGDTIVAWHPTNGVGANLGQGNAYVFVRPAAGWSGILTESARLRAGSEGNSRFGSQVAISGDTIVVGAPFQEFGRGFAGVFVRPKTGWAGTLTETARLVVSKPAAGDLFGEAVAIAGGTVAVAAPGRDLKPFAAEGTVFVYAKPKKGWKGAVKPSATLRASDGAADDQLGTAVAVLGSTVVAGVDLDDALGLPNRGSAYLFERPKKGWKGTVEESAQLLATVSTVLFGQSVALGANTAFVGSPHDDGGRGKVYVFVRPASGWR